MNNEFTHLHVHTDYSLLDGLGKVEDYVARAKELGMKALAFTDHGTMAGLVTAYDACTAAGIKFIGGCEFYCAPDGTSRFDKVKNNPYNHLIVLFKNETGYKNGCVLLTRANQEGFYYKPRIDFDLLKEHSEGLIVLSACAAGAVPAAVLEGDMEKAERLVMQYKAVFGDDYYLEIQDHGLSIERTVITGLLQLSQKCGVKIAATNDCHYVRSEDREAHEWLLCMQTDRTIDDPKRMVYTGDYSLLPMEDMLQKFPYCKEAVYNTQEIADKCDFRFVYGNYRMPKVHIPESYGTDYFRYLEDEAWKGFEKRYPEGHKRREEAKSRLQYELGVIRQMNFAEYFLDIRRTIQTARANDVLVGPGRGSGAGSCMNYCLGITDLEPLQYNLLFERFLNPERISMPDIDTDFDYARKDDVVASEAEANGTDCFAKIATYGTMQAKAVVRSCAKVSGIENHVQVGNKLSKYIGENHSLSEEWEMNPDLREYVESDPRLQKIWEISLKLENTKKSAGTHACGHIPTPVPCEELFPCRVDSESGYLVCEYDMTQAEHLGNLKKDLLMLRNLTVINTAHRLIKERTGAEIPLWTDEILNDREALEMIAAGDTDGVFQLESDGIKKFLRQLQPDCFEDIIAGVALYRPGPMSFIPDYVENKRNPAGIRYDVPALEPILAPTYGIIVYQEQVMQIVQALAGFSMGRADVIRKAMGKKKQDVMDAEYQNFVFGNKDLGIDGCVNRGISKETADDIWSRMEDFAKYAFNKSHAAAYAAISMQTAFLKAHYPLEFAAGLLSSVMDDSDKLMKYVKSFRASGISVLPPDVNKSEYGFSIEGDAVRFGLFAVKLVGRNDAEDIPRKRPYRNLTDFIERNSDASSRAFENLAKAGALDSFGYNRHTLLENIKDIVKGVRKKKISYDEAQFTLADFGMDIEYGSADLKPFPEYGYLELCRMEKESTGMYISGHPAASIEKTALKNGAVNISELLGEETLVREDDNVTIYGVVTEMSRKYTKAGKPMVIFKLDDGTGEMTVFVFDQAIQKYGNNICEDGLLLLYGKVRGTGEDRIVILDRVCEMKDVPSILWFMTDDSELAHLRKQALAFMKRNPGVGDFVYIASRTSRKRERLGEISLSGDVLARAKTAFGERNIAVREKKVR